MLARVWFDVGRNDTFTSEYYDPDFSNDVNPVTGIGSGRLTIVQKYASNDSLFNSRFAKVGLQLRLPGEHHDDSPVVRDSIYINYSCEFDCPEPLVPACHFTPDGEVSMYPGEILTFAYMGSEDCTGYTINISPADGTAGLSKGTLCSMSNWTISSPYSALFKVRACQEGEVSITVRDPSSVVKQTILLTVLPTY
jgi:hypothetical protein